MPKLCCSHRTTEANGAAMYTEDLQSVSPAENQPQGLTPAERRAYLISVVAVAFTALATAFAGAAAWTATKQSGIERAALRTERQVLKMNTSAVRQASHLQRAELNARLQEQMLDIDKQLSAQPM